jgi:hypothetical protein
LSGGDILKRDRILYGFTFDEIKPYIKYHMKWMIFREAVTTFLVGKTDFDIEKNNKQQQIGEYCNGRYVEECKKYFGGMLANACSTCPN